MSNKKLVCINVTPKVMDRLKSLMVDDVEDYDSVINRILDCKLGNNDCLYLLTGDGEDILFNIDWNKSYPNVSCVDEKMDLDFLLERSVLDFVSVLEVDDDVRVGKWVIRRLE